MVTTQHERIRPRMRRYGRASNWGRRRLPKLGNYSEAVMRRVCVKLPPPRSSWWSLMKDIGSNPESSHFLNGWKEIADYLGKGVCTVQRYERELHLPARRPADKPRSAVIATSTEIDAWVVTSLRLEGIHSENFLCLSPKVALSAIRNSIADMHQREFHMSLATLQAELNDGPRQYSLTHFESRRAFRASPKA